MELKLCSNTPKLKRHYSHVYIVNHEEANSTNDKTKQVNVTTLSKNGDNLELNEILKKSFSNTLLRILESKFSENRDNLLPRRKNMFKFPPNKRTTYFKITI